MLIPERKNVAPVLLPASSLSASPKEPMPTPPSILGFDTGRARIGIARSTALGTAEPLATLRAKNRPWADILAEIQHLAAQYQPDEFVVGLPRNMDGSLGPQARHAQRFAQRLQAACPAIPVHLEDERLTTEAAYERLAEQNIRGEKARQQVDATAAAIIVEARLARLRRDESA